MPQFNDTFWIIHGTQEPDREVVVFLDRATLDDVDIEGTYHDEHEQPHQALRQILQDEFMPPGYEVNAVVKVMLAEGPQWQLPYGTVLEKK